MTRNPTCRPHRRLVLACAVGTLVLATGCAPRDLRQAAKAHGQVTGPSTVAFPGARMAATGPFVEEADQVLANVRESCPSFAERELWLECNSEPCHVYLWGPDMATDDAWDQASCNLAPGAAMFGYETALGDGDAMLHTTVYVLASGETVNLEAERARIQQQLTTELWLSMVNAALTEG